MHAAIRVATRSVSKRPATVAVVSTVGRTRVATAPLARAASSSGADAPTQQASGDWLFPVKRASTTKAIWHYTQYALAGIVPVAAFADGGAVAAACDWSLAVVLPLHFHIGMRSVIVDYVHGLKFPGLQRGALAALGVVTLLTAAGIAKVNIGDVGVSGAVKGLWKKPAKKVEDEASA